MQVPQVRRQSAFDTAPAEHSLALSAFQRRTTGQASGSNGAASPVPDRTGQAKSEPYLLRLPVSNHDQTQPSSGPLTLDEVSAAVAAAKLTLSAPASGRSQHAGATLSSVSCTVQQAVISLLSSSLTGRYTRANTRHIS